MQATTVVALSDATFDEWMRGSHGPVVVDFWADWCPPCKVIEKHLVELADEYADRIAFASVDADVNPELTRRFRVLSMPTLLLISGGGARELVGTIVGSRPKTMLREAFDQLVA